MNVHVPPEAANDIVALVTLTPTIVLTDEAKREALFLHIRGEIKNFVPDLTTDKGRKAIATFARKIVTTKTAVDEAGADMIAEERAKIDLVNAGRRIVKETLDELRDEARKPLTDYEAIDKTRVDKCQAVITKLRTDSVVSLGTTAAQVRERLAVIGAMSFAEDEFKELAQLAVDVRAAAIAALEGAATRLTQAEAEAAELVALRASQAESDRVAKIAEDARLESAAAAERDRLAAAALAEQERLAQVRETEAASVAGNYERAQAAEAIAAAEAETARLQKAEDDRTAAAKLAADEQLARNADAAHRKAVVKAATQAVMAAGGIDEVIAGKIVMSILVRQIPNVTLKF